MNLLLGIILSSSKANSQGYYTIGNNDLFSPRNVNIFKFTTGKSCLNSVICPNIKIEKQPFILSRDNQIHLFNPPNWEVYDLNTCTLISNDSSISKIYQDSFFLTTAVTLGDDWIWCLGNGICKYNLKTKEIIQKEKGHYASIPKNKFAKGDGAFTYKNEIYFIRTDSGIYKLDTNNFLLSKYQFGCPPCIGNMSPGSIWGITSVKTACDTERVFAYLCFKGLYEIIMETGEYKLICPDDRNDFYYENAKGIWYLPPHACDLLIDLDRNNSSGKSGNDYFVEYNCTIDKIPITDSDVFVFSDIGKIDSIFIQLKSGQYDGNFESIYLPNSTKFHIKKRSNVAYWIFPEPNINFQDIQYFLSQIHYSNTSWPYTPGERIIEISAFLNDWKTSSFTFINLPKDVPNKINILDTLICIGDKIILKDQKIFSPGTYVAKLENLKHCDSIVVWNVILDSEKNCNCDIQFPNVFTPNQDNQNDDFRMYNPCQIEFSDYELSIYNRWGQNVWKSNDPNINWDGSTLGQQGKITDTYVYIFKAVDQQSHQIVRKKGVFTLLY